MVCELHLSETVRSLVWVWYRVLLYLSKNADAIAWAYWDKAATRASPQRHTQLPWEVQGDSLEGQGDQKTVSQSSSFHSPFWPSVRQAHKNHRGQE